MHHARPSRTAVRPGTVILMTHESFHKNIYFKVMFRGFEEEIDNRTKDLLGCEPKKHSALCAHCLQPCSKMQFAKDIFSTKWPVVGLKGERSGMVKHFSCVKNLSFLNFYSILFYSILVLF